MRLERKKWLCLLLSLALALTFAACGGDDEDSSASASGEESSSLAEDASGSDAAGSSAASGEEDASAGSEAAPAATPAPPAVDLPTGKFLCLNEDKYPAERAPALEISADGSASFMVNTGIGLANVSGSVALSGHTLTFTVQSMDFADPFVGSGSATIPFRVVSQDGLEYTGGGYGLLMKGDLFTRDGMRGDDVLANAALQSSVAQPAGGDSSAAGSGESTAQSGASQGAAGGAQSGDASASEASSLPDVSLPEGTEGVWTVGPGDAPPESLAPGDSFMLAQVDIASIGYDSGLFSAEVGADNQSVIFTALKNGSAKLEYKHLGEDEVQNHTIKVSAGGGVPLWMVIAVAGGSVALGGGLAMVLMGIMRKNKKGGKRKKKKGKGAAEPEPQDALLEAEVTSKEGKKAMAALKKARANAKKAEKKAADLEKKAAKVASTSAKAAGAAQKARDAATSAAGKIAEREEKLREAIQHEEEAAAAAEAAEAAEDGGEATPPPAKEPAPEAQAPAEEAKAEEAPKTSMFGEQSNGN